MPNWIDILDGVAGGAFGVTKGLTAGAEPFKAWEGVRSADLANQKSELTLRDLQQLQAALENPELDYYGNAATAKNTANKLATSKGNLDIFGNERSLDLGQSLYDPNGFFQMTAQAKGLTPADPEYRQLLAQMIGQVDPTAGVKAEDSFNVPKLQQQRVNEQAVLGFVQQYARMQDPGATVTRGPDGQVYVVDSDGVPTPVSGDLLVKVAAMLQAQTPADAIYKGFADERATQKTNSDILKVLEARGITPAKALTELKQLRIGLDKDISDAMREYNKIVTSTEYQQQPDKAARDEMVREPLLRAQAARAKKDKVMELYAQVATTSRVPGTEPIAPAPRVAPTGNTTVTTRPSIEDVVARAAGAASSGAPRAAGPMRPGEVGGSIGFDLFGIQQDPLGAFINSLGIQ